jgi:choline kinase
MGPCLVVLAAGMGSRYGGLKQLDPMGPSGETVLDYAVFDALRAGFGRVVFVIRRDFADQFQTQVVSRYANRIDVTCVCQDLDDVPDGHVRPVDRSKPWGTLHAVLAARRVLTGAFAVINADDFYGQDAYVQMARHLMPGPVAQLAPPGVARYAMVGYAVESTLSQNGGVNRGICQVTQGLLTGVEEVLGIVRLPDGQCQGRTVLGQTVPVLPQAVASMNFWGFTSDVLPPMLAYFSDFLTRQGSAPGAECYIPSLVDHLIHTGQADCRVLPTLSEWFGVTYPQDRASCMARLQQLVAQGAYPSNLWV